MPKINFYAFEDESGDVPVSYGISESGELFLPGTMAAPAAEVLMRAGYKCVVPVAYQGRFYFPLSWLKDEYADSAPLWQAFEEKMKASRNDWREHSEVS